MKITTWILGLSLTAGMAWAQLDLPKDVLKMTELDAARAEAKREKETLMFLKVNPADGRDFMEEAVDDYVSVFKRFGPILLVPLNVEVPDLPTSAETAFDNMSGGYPQLVVLDPDDDSVIVKVPYLARKDRDDELKAHRRRVHKYLRDKKKKRPVPVPKPLF